MKIKQYGPRMEELKRKGKTIKEIAADVGLKHEQVLHIEGWLLLQHGSISNLLRSTQRNSPSINGCELYYNLLFL